MSTIRWVHPKTSIRQPTDESLTPGSSLGVRPVLLRGIKVESIAIKRGLVYNQACRQSHDRCVISHFCNALLSLFNLIN